MKQGFFATTLAIFLFSSLSFNTLHAGEVVEVIAAEEAGETLLRSSVADVFGKDAAGALTRGELEEMAQQTLGGGFKDIGELPMEGQAALKFELIESYLKLESEGVEVENLFAKENLASLDVRNNFIEDLKGIQERGGGFGDMQYEAINKFAPEGNELTEFPVRAAEAQALRANTQAGFEPDPKAIPESQQALSEAQNVADGAVKDLEWAENLGDTEKITQAQSNLDAANADLTGKIKAYNSELEANVEKTGAKVKTTKKAAEDGSSSGEGETQVKNRKAEQDANSESGEAVKVKIEEDRESIGKAYEDAEYAKRGTSKARDDVTEANTKVIDEQKKVTAAQKKVDAAAEGTAAKTAAQKELTAAQEELTTAKTELREVRMNEGTEGKLRQANVDLAEAESELKTAKSELKTADDVEAAQSKVDGAQKNVAEKQQIKDDALEADKKAQDTYEAARDKAEAAGKLGWKTKGKVEVYAGKGKALLKEQLINGVIMGFTFALPNWVIEKVQSWWSNKNEREATKVPQRFGDMWLQIPYQLISEGDRATSGKPVEVKYLYVGLEKGPKEKSVERDDTIDLANAQFFMPRDDYDEYAMAGIGDPGFPNKMVHLNTGLHFYGDGVAVAGEEVVQFLQGEGQQLPSWMRQPLKNHLDDQAGQITDPNVSYKGSSVIANQFDSGENDQVATDYPGFAQEGGKYGSLLNAAINSLMNGTTFGTTPGFKIQGFKPLDKTTDKAMLDQLGIADGPLNKPWVAFGTYVYQTADTPNVKSVRKKLDTEGKSDLANKVVEYVVMVEDKSNIDPLPLQIPYQALPYNFPTYVVNPKATKMLSLYDGTLYDKLGKTDPLGDVSKLIPQIFLMEPIRLTL